MAKSKPEMASIDIFIEEAFPENNKTGLKSVLKIPFTISKTNKALRVYGPLENQKFYASVRTGSLLQTEEGYECNVTGSEAELIGNRFELTEVGTKEVVLRGKIANKKAEATVVDLPKTASK